MNGLVKAHLVGSGTQSLMRISIEHGYSAEAGATCSRQIQLEISINFE